MAHGDVTRLELWDALAEGWQLDSIDLIAHPPDLALVTGLDSSLLIEERWVPVDIERADDGASVAVVAVCDEPDARRGDDIAERLGVDRVRFVATTDWDVEQAILAAFSDELVTRAAFELAEERPELSAADPIAAWQKVAGLALAASVLVGALLDWRAACWRSSWS